MGEKQQEGDKKKNEGEKKGEGGTITVVLKLDMHCEGCAKKVRRSVKHFDGVDSVKTDCGSGKLTVIGKVDPTKIKDRVEEKTKKKVEIISPQPSKASKEGGGGGGEKKSNEKKPDEKKAEGKSEEKKSEGKSDGKNSEEKEKEKPKEKPKEPSASTVILKTRVHCEGCAQKIRKIVGKYQGVQDVKVDLQKDTITIKGTMNMKELLPYLNVKLKRTVELAPASGGDKKPKEGSGDPSGKPKEGGEKPKEGGGGEKKKEGGGDKKDKEKDGGEKKDKEGTEKKEKDGPKGGESSTSQENTTRIEVNKMEYGGYPYGYGYGYGYTYDPRQQGEAYGHQVVEYWNAPEYSHPPQMFSDENPNACSVM